MNNEMLICVLVCVYEHQIYVHICKKRFSLKLWRMPLKLFNIFRIQTLLLLQVDRWSICCSSKLTLLHVSIRYLRVAKCHENGYRLRCNAMYCNAGYNPVLPQRRKQLIHPNRWALFTKVHCVISQTNVIFTSRYSLYTGARTTSCECANRVWVSSSTALRKQRTLRLFIFIFMSSKMCQYITSVMELKGLHLVCIFATWRATQLCCLYRLEGGGRKLGRQNS